MKGKRGYFFIIDAFIGGAIIFVTLYIIFNAHANAPEVTRSYGISEDYISFLLDTKMIDLPGNYSRNLTQSGIANPQYTVVEQVTRFFYNAYYVCPIPPEPTNCRLNNLSFAGNLVQEVTEGVIPNQYGMEYDIKDGTYNATLYSRNLGKKNSSSLAISSKKITFLLINQTDMYGPIITEVVVWQ